MCATRSTRGWAHVGVIRALEEGGKALRCGILNKSHDFARGERSICSPVYFFNRLLGGIHNEALDLFEINALSSLLKIVIVLHREPTLRRAPERHRKPQSHLWRYCALTTNQAGKCRRHNVEPFSQLAKADPVRLKINLVDEFARMWGIVHSHQ